MNEIDLNHIFFYGTLKTTEINSHFTFRFLKDNQIKFIGKGRLKNKRPLIVASRCNLPFILDRKEIGSNVKGEIFEIYSNETLKAFDEFEDCPVYYSRIRCTVIHEETGIEYKCWVYVLRDFRERLLEVPCLSEYKTEEHEKPCPNIDDRPHNCLNYMFDVRNPQMNSN